MTVDLQSKNNHYNKASTFYIFKNVGIMVGNEKSIINGRDIVVQTVSGQLIRVPETHGCYDPLQYPLLLPYGNNGWDLNSRNENGTPVTCREYYAYLLQVRT